MNQTSNVAVRPRRTKFAPEGALRDRTSGIAQRRQQRVRNRSPREAPRCHAEVNRSGTSNGHHEDDNRGDAQTGK